jgi:hypothetical protein
MSRDDAKDLKKQKRRTNKARNFPTNTCPASHMMAEALARGEKYWMFEGEPEHCDSKPAVGTGIALDAQD